MRYIDIVSINPRLWNQMNCRHSCPPILSLTKRERERERGQSVDLEILKRCKRLWLVYAKNYVK